MNEKGMAMTYQGFGRVIKGVGGLFTVRMMDMESRLHANTPMPLDGKTVFEFMKSRGYEM